MQFACFSSASFSDSKDSDGRREVLSCSRAVCAKLQKKKATLNIPQMVGDVCCNKLLSVCKYMETVFRLLLAAVWILIWHARAAIKVYIVLSHGISATCRWYLYVIVKELD